MGDQPNSAQATSAAVATSAATITSQSVRFARYGRWGSYPTFAILLLKSVWRRIGARVASTSRHGSVSRPLVGPWTPPTHKTKGRKLLVVALATLAVACGSEGGAGATRSDSQSPGGLGERVYERICAGCHAPDGSGFVGPDLRGVAERLSEEEHLDRVRHGFGGMPAFEGRLSDEEIRAVVRYERETFVR